MTTYGSLLGVNASGAPFVEVARSQFHDLLRSLIMSIEVDERWYLETYGDVAAAVQEGRIASGREHYRTAGYFEDRMPRPIKVEEAWYLKTYPDVTEALSDRKVTSALQHFQKDGFREGRLPSEGWRL